MRIEPRQRRSSLARWSRRTAVAGLIVLAITITGHRSQLFASDATLVLIAIGLALAGFAVLMAFLAFIAIWRDGRAGARLALHGLVLAIVMLAYPMLLVSRMIALPAIADISTDTVAPPEFAAIRWSHPLPSPEAIEAQQTAYPEIVTRSFPEDAERVFAELGAIVESKGWEIVRLIGPGIAAPAIAVTPPDPDQPASALFEPSPGWIEAIARTPIVAFREDVVIRITPDQTGAIVDIRSASRTFTHDLGSNAQRIVDLLAALEDRLSIGPDG